MLNDLKLLFKLVALDVIFELGNRLIVTLGEDEDSLYFHSLKLGQFYFAAARE